MSIYFRQNIVTITEQLRITPIKNSRRSIASAGEILLILLDTSGSYCLLALILTPGPMVEAVTQLRIYWPLAAAGLALMIAPMRAT